MFNAYNFVLVLHSWVRWLVLALGVMATVTSWSDRDASGYSDRWGMWFMMAVDLQLLLGLTLYFGLSPVTAKAMSDFGAAMHIGSLRFFAVDHAVTMLIAVVLAHAGRVLGRKARTPQSRRVRQTVCFGIATILMLAGIPWPGTPNGRPLLRM